MITEVNKTIGTTNTSPDLINDMNKIDNLTKILPSLQTLITKSSTNQINKKNEKKVMGELFSYQLP